MKISRTFSFFLLALVFFLPSVHSQTMDGNWSVDYVTDDNSTNGTGYNTPSIGVVNENTFVALVQREANSSYEPTSFLVGYTNADSAVGRLGTYAYGSSIRGYEQQWTSGFDAVNMYQAFDIAVTPDSLIYVANNDPNRNILVFKLSADSIVSTDYRMSTGTDSIWAVDVDAQGYVYVTTIADSGTAGKVLVFNGFDLDPNWALLHSSTPVASITVPDAGQLRGVAVNSAGTALYVSNYDAKKVYCYTGDPVSGFSLNNGFDFTFTDTKIASDSTELLPGPWGLGYMNDKNILFVAADVDFQLTAGYEYGKIFALNPNNGSILDTIDVAEWNYSVDSTYSNHSTGHASGYTSTYNVAFDNNYNLYSQSYYGWTVEKWMYDGTLPTIELTITAVEKENNLVPSQFSLGQNYPNPFNPATTINFSVAKSSNISMKIYSITGQLIGTLINSKDYAPGNYKLSFDASKLASGTYIYVLSDGSRQLTKKMILLK